MIKCYGREGHIPGAIKERKNLENQTIGLILPMDKSKGFFALSTLKNVEISTL